jgi:hypothetical protein
LLHQVLPEKIAAAEVEEADNDENVNYADGSNRNKLFRIAPVILKGPKGTIRVYALFDEGAGVTMLEEEIAEKIGLDGPSERLCLSWMDDHGRTEMTSKKVSPQIAGDFATSQWWQMKDVRTVSKMKLPIQSIEVDKMKKRYSHLRSIPLKWMTNARPQILIGIDHGKLTAHQEVAAGKGLEPFL